MEEHRVQVKSVSFVTHNVKRFQLERPENFHFKPGQATDVSLDLSDWKNELRPFTFTGPVKADYLEFTIKIYTDHKGVTNQLGKIKAGDHLILHEVFGAIQYKGRGVFLAGGAGVTPFIAILRDLNRQNLVSGNKLIFSNKTSADIILLNEFQQMLGNNFINILTRENGRKRIDREFLLKNIDNFDQHFYVCGPDDFVKNILDILSALGAESEALVFEK